MILPAVALGTIPLAIIARMTRSSLLDVLGLDYIRTARAKGLGERAVVRRHGMRNAMLPVVTVIGLQVGGLLLGRRADRDDLQPVRCRARRSTRRSPAHDYAVIQGFTLVIAIGFLVVNLLVDLSYALPRPADPPRMRART